MRLKNWSVFYSGDSFFPPELRSPHLQGNVYGNDKFPDGAYVNTSRVVSIEDKGTHKEATTVSGSVYCLYKEDVDHGAEAQFLGYYERLKMENVDK